MPQSLATEYLKFCCVSACVSLKLSPPRRDSGLEPESSAEPRTLDLALRSACEEAVPSPTCPFSAAAEEETEEALASHSLSRTLCEH